MKKENKNMIWVPKLKKLNSGTGTEIIKITKAFTLVELIVVITILAILATIGFVSFSGYLAGTRDTNRIAQLKSMSDALELYATKKDLPIPDDKVDVKIGISPNEEVIAYQGYIGKNVLETIEYTESGLDPKDKQYFSYYLTKDKKYFQLLAFLEEENEDKLVFHNNVKALDYSERKFITKGRKLGLLLDENNSPIQENSEITGSGYLNVETTNNIYKAVFENLNEESGIIVGTGSTLKMLAGTAWAGGVRNSCKILLEKNSKFKGKDGYYLINQEQPTKVYCDMTTNGGGWTRYINITGEYSLDDAKQCWLAKSNWDNVGKTIECFNPNRLNFIVSEYMVKQDTDGDNIIDKTWNKKFKKSYPSMIENVQYSSSRKCKGGQEYMTIMKSGTGDYPKSDTTDSTYVRLGLSFCDENNRREIGGRGGSYMNYSDSGYGIIPGGRESTIKPVQMFIK